jgi:hypothetical protein
VAVETAAVGAEDGRARLSVRFGPMNRLVGDAHEVASEEVRVIQLDGWWSACGEPTVSLLKIDVEGQELDVLAGSLRLLSSQRPALIVEVNDPHGLSRFVREHGYTHVAFDERTLVVESSPLTCRVGGNAIFVANLDEARERLLRSARPAAGDG